MNQLDWEKLYSTSFGGTWYPNEEVIRFVARYIKRRVGIDKYDLKRDFSKCLDVGCGNGRHVFFLSQQGFDAYGLDISQEGIDVGKAWLNKNNLKATLNKGSALSLPYQDNYFDFVVCVEVLDHLMPEDALKAIAEIKRVCKTGGYIFLSLISDQDSSFGRGEKVANNTFLMPGGYEKGLPQHFFSYQDLREISQGLNIFDLFIKEERFNKIYTADKSYLQSSSGEKRFIKMDQDPDLSLKYSRWYIVAEKQ